jgi:4-diphosphocytidyl-2-C-methyl-D-erythritol kinase
MILTETARAKVNLTLSIRGRRPDGYHALESLVAFADVGDRLDLDTRLTPGLDVVGPFAAGLDSPDNLVLAALDALRRHDGRLRLGRVRLDKQLPVAAGVGGGSADAAAVLRLVSAANPGALDADGLGALATPLGADVAVCLETRAAIMTGIGERVTSLPSLPSLPALLVNPRVPVPSNKTAAVFRALAAPAFAGDSDHGGLVAAWSGLATPTALLERLQSATNDLEPAARVVLPVVDTVLAALRLLPGARLVRLSGAGPTCYGLFETRAAAEAAGRDLRQRQPGWWIAATELR